MDIYTSQGINPQPLVQRLLIVVLSKVLNRDLLSFDVRNKILPNYSKFRKPRTFLLKANRKFFFLNP